MVQYEIQVKYTQITNNSKRERNKILKNREQRKEGKELND